MFNEFKEKLDIQSTSVNVLETDVHFIVPFSGRPTNLIRFLDYYATQLLAKNYKMHLVIVLFITPKETNNDSVTFVRNLTNKYKKLYPKHEFFLTVTRGEFNRGKGITLGLNSRKDDDLVVFMDVDLIFTSQYVDRIILYTRQNEQSYFPIFYSEFDPEKTRIISEDPFEISENRGFWRYYSYGMVSIYKSDYLKTKGFNLDILGWGQEDLQFADAVLEAKINIFRVPDRHLIHIFHDKTCDSEKLAEQQFRECFASKANHFGSVSQNFDKFVQKYQNFDQQIYDFVNYFSDRKDETPQLHAPMDPIQKIATSSEHINFKSIKKRLDSRISNMYQACNNFVIKPRLSSKNYYHFYTNKVGNFLCSANFEKFWQDKFKNLQSGSSTLGDQIVRKLDPKIGKTQTFLPNIFDKIYDDKKILVVEHPFLRLYQQFLDRKKSGQEQLDFRKFLANFTSQTQNQEDTISTCLPCDRRFNYKYLIHYETRRDDMVYLSTVENFSLFQPTKQAEDLTQAAKSAFHHVDEAVKQQLYDLYPNEFILFGFTVW